MKGTIPLFPVPFVADCSLPPGATNFVIAATVALALIDLARHALALLRDPARPTRSKTKTTTPPD